MFFYLKFWYVILFIKFFFIKIMYMLKNFIKVKYNYR